jgi:hypothetical protein
MLIGYFSLWSIVKIFRPIRLLFIQCGKTASTGRIVENLSMDPWHLAQMVALEVLF